jgi:hypothetical protein
MGINNEYGYDAFDGDLYAYDEETYDEEDQDLDPESWEDWHSEHILNMWMSLRQYLEDNYMNNLLMNRATFPDFVRFVRENSS